MFSLRDLRLLVCSLDLDVLRAQRIVGLITHRSIGISDHVVTNKFIFRWSEDNICHFCQFNKSLTFQGERAKIPIYLRVTCEPSHEKVLHE